jgi:hypothetical protein
VRFYGILKNGRSTKKMPVGETHKDFSPSYFPLPYQVSLLQPEHRTPADESGMIRTQMGAQYIGR